MLTLAVLVVDAWWSLQWIHICTSSWQSAQFLLCCYCEFLFIFVFSHLVTANEYDMIRTFNMCRLLTVYSTELSGNHNWQEALQMQWVTRHKYQKSHLKRLAIGEWPSRTLKAKLQNCVCFSKCQKVEIGMVFWWLGVTQGHGQHNPFDRVHMTSYLTLIESMHLSWRCWLGGRKGIWPVKNWVVGCRHGYLSGARCRFAYYGLRARTHYLTRS